MAKHTTPKAYLKFWKKKFKLFQEQYPDKRSDLIQEILSLIESRDGGSTHEHALTLQCKINVLLSNDHDQLHRWQPWFKFRFNFFGLLPRTYTITFGGSELFAMIYRENSNNVYDSHHESQELSHFGELSDSEDDDSSIQYKSHDQIIKQMDVEELNKHLEEVFKKLTRHSRRHGLTALPSTALTELEFHAAKYCLLEHPKKDTIADSCRFLQLHINEFNQRNFFMHFIRLCETDFNGCFDFFIGQEETGLLNTHLGSNYQQKIVTFFEDKISSQQLSSRNAGQYCRLRLLKLDDMSIDEVQDLLAELSTNKQIARQAFIAMATNGLINKEFPTENQFILFSFMADYILNNHIFNKSEVNQIAYSGANLLLLVLTQQQTPSTIWHDLLKGGFSALPQAIHSSLQQRLQQKMHASKFTDLIEGRNNNSGERTNAFNTPTVLLQHMVEQGLCKKTGFINLLIHRMFVNLFTKTRYKHLDFDKKWKSSDNHIMYSFINSLKQLSGQTYVRESEYSSLINTHQSHYILTVMKHRRNEENIAAQVMLAFELGNEIKQLAEARHHIKHQGDSVDWSWIEHRLKQFWREMPGFARDDQITRHRLDFEIGKHRHFIDSDELSSIELDTLPSLESLESDIDQLLKFTGEQTLETYADNAFKEFELAQSAIAAFNHLLLHPSALKLYAIEPGKTTYFYSNFYQPCSKLEAYVTDDVREQWLERFRELDKSYNKCQNPAKVSELSMFTGSSQAACSSTSKQELAAKNGLSSIR